MEGGDHGVGLSVRFGLVSVIFLDFEAVMIADGKFHLT
jgi:hypothetical protein